MWLFAAWVGLVGGVSLLNDAPLYAAGFLALGLVGLAKTVLGAARFLATVPAIVAREREARATTADRARPRPAPAPAARRELRRAAARREPVSRRPDQQRAAA